MSVHSCCCIIFCIAWFEVGFRIELKLYFELLWEKLKRNKFPFSFLSPAFGPLGFALPPAQLAIGLSSPFLPARAEAQRRLIPSRAYGLSSTLAHSRPMSPFPQWPNIATAAQQRMPSHAPSELPPH